MPQRLMADVYDAISTYTTAHEKLVEVLQRDTADANYEKWIVEAYSYRLRMSPMRKKLCGSGGIF